MGSENDQDKPTESSLRLRARPDGISPAEVIAAVLSVIWLLGVVVFFFVGRGGEGGGTVTMLMTLLGVLLPIALIWLAASAARTSRLLREESAQLHDALDTLRRQQSGQQVPFSRTGPKTGSRSGPQGPREIVSPPALTFASRRDPSLRLSPSAEESGPLFTQARTDAAQPVLALDEGDESDPQPLPIADFIRSLNFPESPDDAEGFRALRTALNHRDTGKLIRSSQDVLTLLSQDGIYMDDLPPTPAQPEIWRRFAEGERGAEIAVLGGILDRSSLALAAGRMRQDAVFRDAAHHFLRQFDRSFQSFEKFASDDEIAEAADTRTARAFMLLGRVAGIFGDPPLRT